MKRTIQPKHSAKQGYRSRERNLQLEQSRRSRGPRTALAFGDQIEVGKVRLYVERERFNVREPPDHHPRADGVGIPAENPPHASSHTMTCTRSRLSSGPGPSV
ncbi:protein TRANSPORT INHIBITOR RESPONSE 1-like [Pyrus ussuriensis x Pyrus communis]|uniref:Protein TRANSPORT INHIBITOR RESPONSE 1-like n=1 Tax=Pyrus ussuriensis x Pyrus communis TaxID=2448454 RepID=A0A5N5GCJ2_9ROSA|nr:protein TRANSPORT INHIBITOR RESPONSE 1-like [Pyrus ussuriensis x Pyrus communis]